jgi:outer membrane biosynthesis protein TonB
MINKQSEHIEQEERNKKVLLFSVGIHVTILLLLFLPWFTGLANDEAEPLEGILVDLSYSQEGNGREVMENPTPPKPTPVERQSEVSKPIEVKEVKVSLSTSVAVESQTTVEDELALAAKRKREIEEAEKRKAQEEAARQAEEKRKQEEAFNQSKSRFSDLFKSGGSKGESDNPDKKAGSITGEPNAAALDKISTGKGEASNGLGGRKIIYEPIITDNSQKTGRVVIRVCVDKSGKVVNAKFTQKGSTTTDSYLVDLAIRSAKKYKFTQSEIPEQCGDISIDFRLK